MKTTGDLPQFGECECEFFVRGREQRCPSRRIGSQGRLGDAESDRQRNEALLCSVVKIPFKLSTCAVACGHDPGARIAQLLELRP